MRRIIVSLLASLLIVGNIGTQSDAEIMAKCMWGECRGMETVEQAAVAWCILNRVDSDKYPNTITDVITQPSQFTGYLKSNPVDPELLLLAEDVISRWEREQSGETDVGRVLPREYLYFFGHGGHNHFGTTWPVTREWDWSYEDPYTEDEHDELFSDGGHWNFDWMAGDPGELLSHDGRGRSNGRPISD